MAYCVAGIFGAMYVGKLLDKYKCYKFMINAISITISICLILTFIGLYYDLTHFIELSIIVFTGAPMFSVSTPAQ